MTPPSSSSAPVPFLAFLRERLSNGGFETDDVLAVVLPLFRQVAAAHNEGQVAALDGVHALHVLPESGLNLDAARLVAPRRNPARLEELQRAFGAAVEVVGEQRLTRDADTGVDAVARADVIAPDAPVERPVFIVGYKSWEHAVGHHDPVTDVFSLGLVLASVACELDFTAPEDVALFVERRENLFTINDRLHPVLANVIGLMTELDRHRRAQDLAQIVRWLENYRDQPLSLDWKTIQSGAVADRRRALQGHLRNRLFEISRRNRLIYFKPTLQTLNLTLASVPLVMDVRNIRTEQLFIWQPTLASALAALEPLSLGKYLRFEDAPYLPGVLDKIIAEARRDRAEYGFAQLRLVLCFLRWHNLKELPQERIVSPLLLLSVELAKRKGVRDQYVLTAASSEAEVNPALRHHLKTLYGIELPDTIDLQRTSLDEFFDQLQAQIRASEPGVRLEKIERPKIELIHARARQRLDQWRQRQRRREPASSPRPVSASYDREDYRPRGLQLFLEKVRPNPLPLAALAGAPPRPRSPGWAAEPVLPGEPSSPAVDHAIETEREMFAVRDGDSGNPYHWSFDLCSLTLGNFHYRKMTLVRDYAKLAEAEMPNPAFDSVFSLEPKLAQEPEVAPLSLEEQFPVIPCDAAQAAAVARARDGRSFIIQGPPGTGKSQTITNLIADYVARGKRVLFVCEKRAAIDVVFHRLRQQGLDELCCLIHDSQADKKAFIQNLKQAYEHWLAAPADEAPARARAVAARAIAHDLTTLQRFSDAMQQIPDAAGVSVRALLYRLIELRDLDPDLADDAEGIVPEYRYWLSHGTLLEQLDRVLMRVGSERCFARNPLRWLQRELTLSARPTEELRRGIDQLEPQLDALETRLELTGLDAELWETWADLDAMLAYAEGIQPLAQRDQLALLEPTSPLSRQLSERSAALAAAEKTAQTARQATAHWRERISSVDTDRALAAALGYEASWLRIFQPGYWRLRRTVRDRYDFSAHAVLPTLRQVLTELQAEHRARQGLDELREAFGREFGAASPEEFARFLADARGTGEALPSSAAKLRHALLGDPRPARVVDELVQIRALLAPFRTTLARLVAPEATEGFAALRALLEALRKELRHLPEVLPALSDLTGLPEPMRDALWQLPFRLDQFEAASARRTLHALYRADPALERFNEIVLAAYLGRLDEHRQAWLKNNAGAVRARVRAQFREHVRISELAAAQLTEEEKVFKKNYAAGRRELEHEFGKTMRFKSIRDLAADESGQVIRDLKPVWLMSPLSVSDTLPLDPDLFDVVIFDEASQIPVEEAVPAIYRARQTIVVGDEMQLPPTSFFSAGRETVDTLETEEDAERVEADLEADSFLGQAARNLPSSLLAWHYRSRYENLISFSNAAFYAGNLCTIPDRHLPIEEKRDLRVAAPEQAATHVDALLARSISFHFIENGVYELRRNAAEAAYIAQLVRELLRRDTRFSLGIVAFSEAQQTEIERALDTLAEDDAEFAARLEAETNREEDDQFCGLFVKNLENVQGDERDVILLSICYGYDRSKRMLMNFGPINQRGGEKRLNVIFSRARHHMAVVSSIRHEDITNDYNDGANALRQFLRYAEALSKGDAAAARSVLENLHPLSRRALAPTTERDAVLTQLATALRERGHAVELHVGQSRFRVDLAIRAADEPGYTLGVLVDTEAHYRNADLIDRYLTQPSILRAFGWKITHVLAKDWWREADAVVDRIERLLRGEAPKLPELPEADEEEEVSVAPEPEAPARPESVKATSNAGSRRYLECTEGGSRKFWEVSVVDATLTVRFGRLGTAGQTQQKTCASADEAKRTAEQLASAKLKKGYVEPDRNGKD